MRVRATTAAVVNSKYYIFCVCVCVCVCVRACVCVGGGFVQLTMSIQLIVMCGLPRCSKFLHSIS